MGLNDAAWEKLFEQDRIADAVNRDGRFLISAARIREFREPRLMTKFDHRINLPRIFADNGLAILPVTRGDYVISSFDAYHDFEDPAEESRRIRIPAYIQSLAPQNLVSEAIALNCANACGILADFLEDEPLVPTVSGRMSSGAFDFRIQTRAGQQTVLVNNSQIEIDAAYEGRECLALFEAKRDLADDFLVRQLYYPFRVWNSRMTKAVRPVFLVFSNGVFHLYEYRFGEPENYNSLRLVRQRNYTVATEITQADVEDLLKTVEAEAEPEISFPQANRMERVINLAELLAEREMSRQDITAEYAFDERQTNYYADAGRYLGLMEKFRDGENGVGFRLSPLGRSVMNLGYRERQLAFITQILRHRAFRRVMCLRLRSGEMPDVDAVVREMRGAGVYHVESEATFVRRSSTIVSWIRWVMGLMEN